MSTPLIPPHQFRPGMPPSARPLASLPRRPTPTTPAANRPPYTPAKYLSTGSFLTPQQLVDEYQEFASSLKYVATAPELVFERLVASLKDAFNAAVAVAVEVERRKGVREWDDKVVEVNLVAKLGSVGIGEKGENGVKEVNEVKEVKEVKEKEARLVLKLQNLDIIQKEKEKEKEKQARLVQKLQNLDIVQEKEEKEKEKVEKEEKEKEEKEKKEKEKEREREKEKNASGVKKDSVATGTVVKSDASSTVKPSKCRNLLVGKYSSTLKGVSTCDIGSGKHFHFSSFEIPLKLHGSSPGTRHRTPPITFTKLNFNTPVQRPSFSSTDHSIHVPAQTSYSQSLEVGINWLEISGSEPDFQHRIVDNGSYNCLTRNEFRSTREIRVHFMPPYTVIPHVAVWFSDFTREENNGERLEAKVYATDVTRTGFMINVMKTKPERFLEPIITWFAYSATRKDVFKGTFSTTAVRPWNKKPHTADFGYEKFHSYGLTSPPRILMGFDSLDVDAPKGSVEVETGVADITEKGMSWRINASKPTELNSASVTYLAFA